MNPSISSDALDGQTQNADKLISIIIPSYGDSQHTKNLVNCLHDQQLPMGWAQEIIIIDDGSPPPHSEALALLSSDTTCIITLRKNVGRTAARKVGVENAKGDLLLLIDADCIPVQSTFLAAHIEKMGTPGVIASTGPIFGYDDSFWSRYQNKNMLQKPRHSSRPRGTLGTTANACLSRHAYVAIGGFNLDYAGYGFEDRDLLLRAEKLGSIAWAPAAAVQHMDELSLPAVCRKMIEAGRGNSWLFSRDHPDAYRALGYAQLDGRTKPLLAKLGRAYHPVALPLARALDPMLDKIPFPIARLLVKLLSAGAFFAGTCATHTIDSSIPTASD